MGTALTSGRTFQRAWLLIAAFALATLSWIPARADGPTTLDGLVDLYNVGDVPADLIVVVDTSSSMSEDGNPPPWPSVLRGYKGLVNAIGPSDSLGVITFDATATLRRDPKPISSEKQRQSALEALPNRARGDATDIGAGLEAAVNRLARAGAAEIQNLVVITDGKHLPSADTKYPATSGPGWKKLQREAAEVSDAHRGQLNVYGWETGGGQTDVALVKKVFPDAQILAIPTEQIPGFLKSLASDAQRARVRPEVRQDLDTPIASELILPDTLSSDMQGTLRITNARQGLPTVVDLKGITVTAGDGVVVPSSIEPQEFTLAPGESRDLKVALFPEVDHGLFTLGRRLDQRNWNVQLDATTSLDENLTGLVVTEQLAAEKQTVGSVTSPGAVDASSAYGITWKSFIIGLILLAIAILALFYLLKWLFVPPALSGQLLDENDEPVLRLTGRTVTLPNASVGNPDSDDKVTFFTKPRTPGRPVWIRKESGSPRFRGQFLTNKAKKLMYPDSIEIGGIRLTFRGRKNK